MAFEVVDMVAKGWRIHGEGIACNPDPKLGGIIDRVICTGEWFVIFNDDDIKTIEGLSSRSAAFEAFDAAIKSKYWIE